MHAPVLQSMKINGDKSVHEDKNVKIDSLGKKGLHNYRYLKGRKKTEKQTVTCMMYIHFIISFVAFKRHV